VVQKLQHKKQQNKKRKPVKNNNMKKLGCAQCGGMKKYGDGGAKKTTKKTPKKPRDPFAPQVVSVVKNGKTVYQEKPLKGDKGDSGEKYKYKHQTGGVSIQLPKYSNDPRTNQGRILQDGGMTSTSRQLTRLGKKVKQKMDDGKTISKGLQKRYDKAADKVIAKGFKAKRGGIKK
jgi:hypothetical protein